MTFLSVKDNLNYVISRCDKVCAASNRKADDVTLITVSKTFDGEAILPVLEAGQRIFGENKVQESMSKWPALKEQFEDIELHLIGPLQSNKTGEAVALFDVIQTVDREKIAKTLSKEMKAQNKYPKLLVQINTGSEPQKSGIEPQDAVAFINTCRETYDLDIAGLMCIPPAGENPGPHFALLKKIAKQANVSVLSMGMSSDFEIAIEMGATHVRVGSAIFGSRT